MNKITQQPLENHMDVPRPPGKDVEDGARPESNFRGLSDVQKMKQENRKKYILVLVFRACAMVFSFLSFILVVVIRGFHLHQVASYVFSIALITMVYTAVQVGIKGDELRARRDLISQEIAVWIDFIGDQVLAYLMLSSAIVGAMTATELKNNGVVHPALDQGTAAVAMSFLTFFSLAPAALISGYHLFAELSRSFKS